MKYCNYLHVSEMWKMNQQTNEDIFWKEERLAEKKRQWKNK